MRKVGNHGMVFGSTEEIYAAHPEDKAWGSPRGCIGDAVVRADGTECVSVFIGQGRAVLISPEGRYIDDDIVSVTRPDLSRVHDGAWIPRVLYDRAANGG